MTTHEQEACSPAAEGRAALSPYIRLECSVAYRVSNQIV